MLAETEPENSLVNGKPVFEIARGRTLLLVYPIEKLDLKVTHCGYENETHIEKSRDVFVEGCVTSPKPMPTVHENGMAIVKDSVSSVKGLRSLLMHAPQTMSPEGDTDSKTRFHER
jgi:hypothetical protein